MRRSAFSLVEMLVATVLVTMLLSIAIFSYKHILITFKHIKTNSINRSIDFHQLRSSLQSMHYYIVDDYNNLNQAMKQLHPFINATQEQLLYITKNPIFSTDISLASLSCKNEKLIYQEEPLFQKIDFLTPTMPEESPKKIFFDRLTHCEILYQFRQNSVLPTTVTLQLKTDLKDMVYVTSIQSDFNTSTFQIYSKVYDEE